MHLHARSVMRCRCILFSRGPSCQHVNDGSLMCHTVASNWEACMRKHVSFMARCCRTVFIFLNPADQALSFPSARRMVSRQVRCLDRVRRGHTRPEMEAEKARVIHPMQREVQALAIRDGFPRRPSAHSSSSQALWGHDSLYLAAEEAALMQGQ